MGAYLYYINFYGFKSYINSQGIDTDEPAMQIDQMVFTGNYKGRLLALTHVLFIS